MTPSCDAFVFKRQAVWDVLIMGKRQTSDVQLSYLLLCQSRIGQTPLQLRAVCREGGGSAVTEAHGRLNTRSKHGITILT